MEFSEIFGFLKLLSESIKISLKNVILIASITTISLLFLSIVFLLFSFSYQSATTYMINSTTDSITSAQVIIFFALLFAVELAFVFSYIAIAHATGIATVITAAASYTGAELSLRDLFSTLKTKRTSPFRNNFRRGLRNPVRLLWIVAAAAVVVPVVMLYPNPITITIAIVGVVSLFVFQLYASVAPFLATVIPVVEDGCKAADAVERAEKLVEGQRLNGFMANLFFYVVAVIVCLGFGMMVDDRGGLNLTVYGLFFVDTALVMRIFLSAVYTVYYFRCTEYHSEQIQPLGNADYVKLTDDVP